MRPENKNKQRSCGLGFKSSSSIYELDNFGKLLNTAGPQFSHQKNGDENGPPLLRLL